MQKKSFLKKKKGAGADDMMPPAIVKKQRALLKKMDLEKVSRINIIFLLCEKNIEKLEILYKPACNIVWYRNRKPIL